MKARAMGILLLAAAATVACGPERPDDQETGTITPEAFAGARAELSPEGAALLDSANAAYRKGEYEEALGLYEAAAERVPDAAAPWFGIFMARTALGDVDGADEALLRARERARGATLVHPDLPAERAEGVP